MKNEWIKVNDKLPDEGIEVLTCYWLEASKRLEIGTMTWYKKGTEMDRKFDRDMTHSLFERLRNTLYSEKYAVLAPEDGFYMLEWGPDGDNERRKHKGCITHWRPFPDGPKEK